MQSVSQTQANKMTTGAQLMAGWPLVLVIFGGAIGAALGVVAYVINRKIYTSTLTRINKVFANLLCGMSAISAWWFIAQWVQASF